MNDCVTRYEHVQLTNVATLDASPRVCAGKICRAPPRPSLTQVTYVRRVLAWELSQRR